MSLQEMQLFQEKHEFARPGDIVGTDQPHTASVGMHQGNARDLPDDTQRWASNHPGGIHQQELNLLGQNSEVQESQCSFGRGQRLKKPSSKGREYKLSQIKDKRQRLYSRLLKKSDATEDLFYSSKNKVAGEEELAQFNDIQKLVVAAHKECKQYMEDEWIDEVDEMILNFKRKVHSWLKETNENDRCSKASSKTKSHSSKSSRRSSKASSSGSSKSDRIKGKVKLAELLAQEAFFEKRQQIQNETQRLRMQEKLAKARARAKILENVELGEVKELQGEILGNHQESLYSTQIKKENSEASCSQRDSDYLNPVYQAEQEKERFSSEKKIVDALCHLVKEQLAPDIELELFDGNPLDFHYFMTLFHEVVEKRIDDPRGRLARLLKYTNVNAREMIKHCVQEPPTMGYQHAKKILVEKYGNSYHVMVEYRKEIKAWPIIRSGDVEGYQRFYNFLRKRESITQSAQWNQLNTPDVICMLLAKLPGHIREKWTRRVLSIRRGQMREPGLVDFIELVKDETLHVDDPPLLKVSNRSVL